MADFCKQCSIDIFGEDFGDLANITSKEDEANEKFCVVLCESCGPVQVRNDGSCVGNCERKGHDQ